MALYWHVAEQGRAARRRWATRCSPMSRRPSTPSCPGPSSCATLVHRLVDRAARASRRRAARLPRVLVTTPGREIAEAVFDLLRNAGFSVATVGATSARTRCAPRSCSSPTSPAREFARQRPRRDEACSRTSAPRWLRCRPTVPAAARGRPTSCSTATTRTTTTASASTCTSAASRRLAEPSARGTIASMIAVPHPNLLTPPTRLPDDPGDRAARRAATTRPRSPPRTRVVRRLGRAGRGRAGRAAVRSRPTPTRAPATTAGWTRCAARAGRVRARCPGRTRRTRASCARCTRSARRPAAIGEQDEAARCAQLPGRQRPRRRHRPST